MTTSPEITSNVNYFWQSVCGLETVKEQDSRYQSLPKSAS